MESKIKQEKNNNNNNYSNDSEIDEEELKDQIISISDNEEKIDNNLELELDDMNIENENENENEDEDENENENNNNNELDFNDLEDDDDIRKDFNENILINLNNQNILNENILDLDLENMKKGIAFGHKQEEFLDLFFDSSFYSSRNIEVEKLVKLIKKESNHGLTGLKNLKNTAFMNSIIQCLSHTLDFTYYLLSESYLNEINKNSKTSKKKLFFYNFFLIFILFYLIFPEGTVINSLYNIIKLLWSTNDKSITPNDFKYNLFTYLPIYNNNNLQFDASEFLFNLFEILNDELSLNKKGLKSQATNGNRNIDTIEITSKIQGESDIQASKRFWDFHTSFNKSIISDLFHGQYKSTINCLVCNYSSIHFESFSTITLEIPDLKRIDFIIIPNKNLKPTIKLTCFIPINALFLDLPKFTTEKYRKENNSFFNNEKTKLKCLIVNSSTYSSRFVKLTDNIYQSSKKGNLIIFEVSQDDDENDYYPYICMIKEETKNKQNIQNENKDMEKNTNTNNNNNIDNENNEEDNKNNKEKKEINPNEEKKEIKKVYAYKRKEDKDQENEIDKNKNKNKNKNQNQKNNISRTSTNTNTNTNANKLQNLNTNINLNLNLNEQKEKEDKDSSLKNLSFPRLLNIPLGKNVRYLRLRLYSFMSKYYPFDYKKFKSENDIFNLNLNINININININKTNNTNNSFKEFKEKEKEINSELSLNNDYENIEFINNTNEENFIEYLEKEYKYLFEENNENYEAFSKTEYFTNFPYIVKLVSAKDDFKYKILFSKNPEEFNSHFESEMSLQKLNQYIKQGYKLVIEIIGKEKSKENSNFDLIKTKLNEVICISPSNLFESNIEKDNLNENPYEKEKENTRIITLDDCFDNFTLSEKLEKGNEWYCNCCKKNQNSIKKMELFYLPKNLIITLKRFDTKFIGKTKIQIWKNNNMVKYPVNNLKLYKCFLSNTYYKENNITYDLYSICQHSGSLEGGHYATACRNFGKWYELDDHTVFPSDEETVVSREAYILFYRRK
jgi:ubiquitin C-terminal hydrolase